MTESVHQNSWVQKLRAGLRHSSGRLGAGLFNLFGAGEKLDATKLEGLEELLIAADLGVSTAAALVGTLSENSTGQTLSALEMRDSLVIQITALLRPYARSLLIDHTHCPHCVLVIGVNGSGKTTTIGKLAKAESEAGRNVILAAGDLFRAAAIQQLCVWGERINVPVVTQPPGSDAASLAFSALQKAQAEQRDLLLIDTAGRLHNKVDLMAELQKITRVLGKLDPKAPHDVVLVLDATIGQNSLAQVEAFQALIPVTGLVLTKLDGSAKGGVLVSLTQKTQLPIFAIGVGEGADDLRPFDPQAYAQGLLGVTK